MSRLMLCGVVSALVLASPTTSLADDAEDAAVKRFQKLTALFDRDETRPGKPIVGILFFATEVTDADLKALTALKNLTTLDLSSTKVTDVGLKETRTAHEPHRPHPGPHGRNGRGTEGTGSTRRASPHSV